LSAGTKRHRASGEPPLPPLDLAVRVGRTPGDPYEDYIAMGQSLRQVVLSILPSDWTFDGRRILDLGCGAGRTLRHFLDLADTAELWGCDIHGDSIDWVERHLSPPVRCFRSNVDSPLPVADGHFDLVWAMSVFTHIADRWADWVIEMHRVLAPGGLLIASYLGPGVYEATLGEPYDESRVGMLIQESWRPLDDGGPSVFHSEWWLRRHWGPAFEILEVRGPPVRSDGSSEVGHSFLLARRRDPTPTVDGLERIESGEERETAALQTNVRMLRRELGGIRPSAAARARVRLRRALLRSAVGAPALRLRRWMRRARVR